MRYFAFIIRTSARTATVPQQARETELTPIVPGSFAAWWARTTPETTAVAPAARLAGHAARSHGRATA